MKYQCWNILKIGTVKNAESFRQIFKQKNITLTEGASKLLDLVTFETEPRKLCLGLLSAGQLGFARYGQLSEVYESALSQGLRLCPPETAAYLRIHLLSQIGDDFFRVASKPLVLDNSPHIFSIENSFERKWLNWSDAYPQVIFGRDNRLVWTLPEDSQTS